MFGKSWFPACLLATLIAAILDDGYCADEGFIFPPPSSYSDPILTDIEVSVNESMLVEYVPLADTTYVALSLQCGAAVENVTNLDENDFTDGPWQYENTGILWANISASLEDVRTETNLTTNVCLFTLFNNTIENCLWGPWGLAEFVTAYNYSTPLYYSAIFTVSLVKDGTDHLMVDGNATATTKPAASATAHNTTVTCPPSGVPPTPITPLVPQIDLIPKLAENFTTP